MVFIQIFVVFSWINITDWYSRCMKWCADDVLKIWRRFSWCKMMSRIWHPDDSISMLKRVGILRCLTPCDLVIVCSVAELGNEPCWFCDIESVFCQSTCKVCFSALFCQAAAWLEEPEARSMFAWIEQKEDTKRIVQATLSRTGWPCMACHGMPKKNQKDIQALLYPNMSIYI